MNKLSELLEQNRTNYYKMLVVVDNNRNCDKIINLLKDHEWVSYDVTEQIIKLVEDIPEAKRKVRIGRKIKDWFNTLPDKVILYNTSILYSPELGGLNPVGAFKYKSRGKEIIVFLEGQVSGNRLQYSHYGRPDYSEIDLEGLIHISMEDIDA